MARSKENVKPEPVFIIYSETYAILKEHLADRRFDEEGHRRIVGIVSCWECALADHGDRVVKVVVYYENGHLTWQAYETNDWHGEADEGEDL